MAGGRSDLVNVSASIVGLADAAGSGVHVPNGVGYAGRAGYLSPLACVGVFGIGPPNRLIDDERTDTTRWPS